MAALAAESPQYLSFFVAGEEYGVGILQVREILELDAVTRVPGTPPFVRGVLNLRGQVVPVVDLAVKLGLPETQVTKRTCVVIVEVTFEGQPTVVGMMADAISQVIELPPELIEPPPPFGLGIRAEFLRGMGKGGKKFVLLLDIDKVLTTHELLAVTAIADEAEGAEEASGEDEAAATEPAADEEGAPGPSAGEP